MMAVSRDELFEAIDDMVARAREWDGGSIEDKLAAFGFDADDVSELIHDRWERYSKFPTEEPHLLLASGLVEGLLAGQKLGINKERERILRVFDSMHESLRFAAPEMVEFHLQRARAAIADTPDTEETA